MAWILNRAGQQQQEGPFDDGQILQLIQSGQLREGYVSQPGSNHWIALGEHPPFARALRGGVVQQRRPSGTMVMEAEPSPTSPAESPTAEDRGSAPTGAMWNAQTAYVGAAMPTQPGTAAGAPTPLHHAAGNPQPAYAYGQAPAYADPNPQQHGVSGQAPGAPPPGWGGPAAAAPPTQARQVSSEKKRGFGLIIGGVIGLVLAVVLVAGAFMLLGGGGSRLSAFVPRDVLVFVELPSSTHAIKGALGMDFLNPTEVDAEKQLQNAVKGLTEAFKLNKEDAEEMVLAVDGVAVAHRKEAGRDQVAMLLAFRDGGSVEPWLSSERVTKDGKFGTSGERYMVARSREELGADASAVIRSLSGVQVDKDDKNDGLVWFGDAKVLAFGTIDLLDDMDSVISKGEGALADADAFKAADFSSGAALIAFVSPDILDEFKGEQERKLIQGYLDDIAPFTLDASFVDAGVLTRLRGQLHGKEVSEDEKLPEAVELRLQERLPRGTVAYVAVASAREEDGKALKTRMLKQLRSTDPEAAEQLEVTMGQLETGAGIGFERILDAIGTQAVLGLVVEPDFKLDPKKNPTEQIEKLCALLLLEVGKEDAANDAVKQLRTKLFEDGPLKPSYDVKQQGQGFQGLPKDPTLPTVQVFFHEGNLLVGVGGKPVLAKGLLALGGKGALGEDEAHQRAVRALGAKPRSLVWVDTGRVARATLDVLDEPQRRALDEAEKELGVSHKAIEIEGDDRITAALAVFLESEGERWNYTIEALNAPAFATLGALGEFVKPSSTAVPEDGLIDPTLPAVPGLFLPRTGVPQCDGMILVMSQCGERTGDAALSEEARALEARLKADFADPAKKAAAEAQCSQDLLQFMLKNQKCAGN